MTVLQRYILTGFLRWLMLSFAVFITLFYLIHFIEKVDELFSSEAHARHFIRYLLYMTPSIATQILPIAVLLAVFATIGGFSRSHELTSMAAGGLSLGQIARPMIVTGGLLCLLVLVAKDQVVPVANQRADYLMRVKIKGLVAPYVFRNENLYFRDGNRILHIESSHPAEQVIKGVALYTLRDDFTLAERIDAVEARYDGTLWQFRDLVVRSFADDGKQLLATRSESSRAITLSQQPRDLLERSLESENMTLRELDRHIGKLTREGFDPLRYRVDFHYRIADGLTCLLMVLVAIPFAVRRGRYSSLSMGILVTLVIGLVYFVCQSMLLAFGYAGILPPLVAAWSTNLLFALIGSWLFIMAPS